MPTSLRMLVTISRQMGAGGAYVGQALARRTGLRYVDREILQEAARVLGRDDRDIEGLEERVSTLWSRMGGILAWGAPEAAYVPPPMPALYEEDLFAVESGIIRGIAGREDAVFVGRAAGWVLRDAPGLISVFLHAPELTRAQRIMESYTLPSRDEALDLLKQSDQQRSRFLQSLRGRAWLDAGQYLMCFDTGAVALDEVVDLLAGFIAGRRASSAA